MKIDNLRNTISMLLLAIMLGSSGISYAAPAQPPIPATASQKTASPPPKETAVVTHGEVEIEGKKIDYTATAGTIVLRDKDENPTASIFYMAYRKDGTQDESHRPITFAYNGGPGSSSVWLHLGGVGPKRITTSNAAFTPAPPYELGNNPYSILDKTDLVFIDPVGTGYSRPLEKAQAKTFWGVDEDVASIGQFIERYVTKFNRWNSPKFLLGESYGTARSAALAYYLQEKKGIQLNGVMLVSCILNFEAYDYTQGNDLPYIMYLPSYAAVAWYHHKITIPGNNLPAFLHEVEQFATGDYATALMKGSKLTSQEEDPLAQKLSKYSGLSAAFWKKADLRVNNSEFEAKLLGAEGKTTGRLDARFSGYALNHVMPFPEYEADQEAIGGAFTAAINSYLRNDLNYKSRRSYVIISDEAGRSWDWKHKPPGSYWGGWPGFTNVLPDLAYAMTENPYLHVMVNNGYFDVGTPFYATLYSFEHLGLPKPLQSHVHIYNYTSGHMIYLKTSALKELRDNMVRFIDLAAPASRS